jgi:glycosyltransferase involved in cell wall biosynthesis
MGRRGRERVMRLFSPEVVAAQYLKLYEEVL